MGKQEKLDNPIQSDPIRLFRLQSKPPIVCDWVVGDTTLQPLTTEYCFVITGTESSSGFLFGIGGGVRDIGDKDEVERCVVSNAGRSGGGVVGTGGGGAFGERDRGVARDGDDKALGRRIAGG